MAHSKPFPSTKITASVFVGPPHVAKDVASDEDPSLKVDDVRAHEEQTVNSFASVPVAAYDQTSLNNVPGGKYSSKVCPDAPDHVTSGELFVKANVPGTRVHEADLET